MITPADLEFHERDPGQRLWTETTYLAFVVPEARLHGTLYVLARPNLGIVHSSVVIARGMRWRAHELDFCDPQMHLPCPESYARFDLDNGLSVEAHDLREWSFRYEHALGACRFDLEFTGTHHPYDALDPAENPSLPSGTSVDPRVGDAWSNGHFDLKGRVVGQLELRGETYAVDCYEGMDRSWGPRSETPDRASAYISANFGREMSLWLTTTLDLRESGTLINDRLNSGFVVRDGRVRPIIDSVVEPTRVDMATVADRLEVTDKDGSTYELMGRAIGTRPVGSLNPSIAAFLSLMEYSWDGRVGNGGHGNLFGVNYLAERRGGGRVRAFAS